MGPSCLTGIRWVVFQWNTWDHLTLLLSQLRTVNKNDHWHSLPARLSSSTLPILMHLILILTLGGRLLLLLLTDEETETLKLNSCPREPVRSGDSNPGFLVPSPRCSPPPPRGAAGGRHRDQLTTPAQPHNDKPEVWTSLEYLLSQHKAQTQCQLVSGSF